MMFADSFSLLWYGLSFTSVMCGPQSQVVLHLVQSAFVPIQAVRYMNLDSLRTLGRCPAPTIIIEFVLLRVSTAFSAY